MNIHCMNIFRFMWYISKSLINHLLLPWILHGALHPPLIERRVIHLNTPSNIFPNPPTKSVQTAIHSCQTKLTPRNHHVSNWGPGVVLRVIDLVWTSNEKNNLNSLVTSPFAKILLSTSPPHTKICPDRMAIPGRIRPMSMDATLFHSCLKVSKHSTVW